MNTIMKDDCLLGSLTRRRENLKSRHNETLGFVKGGRSLNYLNNHWLLRNDSFT
jgi:hypothetical protein